MWVQIRSTRRQVLKKPKWENLSNNVGAQYFWIDRIFDWRADPFELRFPDVPHFTAWHLGYSSLVFYRQHQQSADHECDLQSGPRLTQALRFGKETLAGGGLNNKQLNDYVPPNSPLAQYHIPPATVYSPRVLNDGADSVGALGALNRVYLNIVFVSAKNGCCTFRPLIGGKGRLAD